MRSVDHDGRALAAVNDPQTSCLYIDVQRLPISEGEFDADLDRNASIYLNIKNLDHRFAQNVHVVIYECAPVGRAALAHDAD